VLTRVAVYDGGSGLGLSFGEYLLEPLKVLIDGLELLGTGVPVGGQVILAGSEAALQLGQVLAYGLVALVAEELFVRADEVDVRRDVLRLASLALLADQVVLRALLQRADEDDRLVVFRTQDFADHHSDNYQIHAHYTITKADYFYNMAESSLDDDLAIVIVLLSIVAVVLSVLLWKISNYYIRVTSVESMEPALPTRTSI
jgi:hypothetical protein